MLLLSVSRCYCYQCIGIDVGVVFNTDAIICVCRAQYEDKYRCVVGDIDRCEVGSISVFHTSTINIDIGLFKHHFSLIIFSVSKICWYCKMLFFSSVILQNFTYCPRHFKEKRRDLVFGILSFHPPLSSRYLIWATSQTVLCQFVRNFTINFCYCLKICLCLFPLNLYMDLVDTFPVVRNWSSDYFCPFSASWM